MERIISDEEKLRKAIEISQRRNNNYYKPTTTRVNVNKKKNYKLFKKMILQIVICLLIYIIFYLITTTNYVFSADVIKNTNEILNYDFNFSELYDNIILFLNSNTEQATDGNNIILENSNSIITKEQNIIDNTLITQKEDTLLNKNEVEDEIKEKTDKENSKQEKKDEESNKTAKTQMEIDAETAEKICKFQKPLTGTITSEFGEREATIEGMTTDHKGIDIAADSGTSIKSAIGGTVTVAEENSEYGKFIKIVNGDVMTVYAHCKKLKVKVGDKIKIGQTIATVGSTGNSTGPHLHFEIRLKDRYINPRSLIVF